MAAKKSAQTPAKKETSTSTRVVLTVSSWQHKAGEVIEADPATAKRLVAEGYARPA